MQVKILQLKLWAADLLTAAATSEFDYVPESRLFKNIEASLPEVQQGLHQSRHLTNSPSRRITSGYIQLNSLALYPAPSRPTLASPRPSARPIPHSSALGRRRGIPVLSISRTHPAGPRSTHLNKRTHSYAPWLANLPQGEIMGNDMALIRSHG